MYYKVNKNIQNIIFVFVLLLCGTLLLYSEYYSYVKYRHTIRYYDMGDNFSEIFILRIFLLYPFFIAIFGILYEYGNNPFQIKNWKSWVKQFIAVILLTLALIEIVKYFLPVLDYSSLLIIISVFIIIAFKAIKKYESFLIVRKRIAQLKVCVGRLDEFIKIPKETEDILSFVNISQAFIRNGILIINKEHEIYSLHELNYYLPHNLFYNPGGIEMHNKPNFVLIIEKQVCGYDYYLDFINFYRSTYLGRMVINPCNLSDLYKRDLNNFRYEKYIKAKMYNEILYKIVNMKEFFSIRFEKSPVILKNESQL